MIEIVFDDDDALPRYTSATIACDCAMCTASVWIFVDVTAP